MTIKITFLQLAQNSSTTEKSFNYIFYALLNGREIRE